MNLQQELGLRKPIENLAHHAVLSIVFTGDMLAKEGDRLLSPFRLTEAQFNVLMLLKHQASQEGISQTDLSRMLLVNRANVTGLADRMERDGLIVRTSDPKDRRRWIIQMTSKGQSCLEQAEKVYFARLEEVLGSVSSKDQETLVRILNHVRCGLQG